MIIVLEIPEEFKKLTPAVFKVPVPVITFVAEESIVVCLRVIGFEEVIFRAGESPVKKSPRKIFPVAFPERSIVFEKRPKLMKIVPPKILEGQSRKVRSSLTSPFAMKGRVVPAPTWQLFVKIVAPAELLTTPS